MKNPTYFDQNFLKPFQEFSCKSEAWYGGTQKRIGFSQKQSIEVKDRLNVIDRLIALVLRKNYYWVQSTGPNGSTIFLNINSLRRHTGEAKSTVITPETAKRLVTQFRTDYENLKIAKHLVVNEKITKEHSLVQTVKKIREQESKICDTESEANPKISIQSFPKGEKNDENAIVVDLVHNAPPEMKPDQPTTYLLGPEFSEGATKKARKIVKLEHDKQGNLTAIRERVDLYAEKTQNDDSLDQEIAFLKELNDVDGIVRLLNSFTLQHTDGKTYQHMIEEFCNQGDLSQYADDGMSDAELAKICRKIIGILQELITRNIVNSDWKLQNILVTLVKGGAQLKLADFDTAFKTNNPPTKPAGTPLWMSPYHLAAQKGQRFRAPQRIFQDELFSVSLILLVLITKGAILQEGSLPWFNQEIDKNDPETMRQEIRTYAETRKEQLAQEKSQSAQVQTTIYDLLLSLTEQEIQRNNFKTRQPKKTKRKKSSFKVNRKTSENSLNSSCTIHENSKKSDLTFSTIIHEDGNSNDSIVINTEKSSVLSDSMIIKPDSTSDLTSSTMIRDDVKKSKSNDSIVINNEKSSELSNSMIINDGSIVIKPKKRRPSFLGRKKTLSFSKNALLNIFGKKTNQPGKLDPTIQTALDEVKKELHAWEVFATPVAQPQQKTQKKRHFFTRLFVTKKVNTASSK